MISDQTRRQKSREVSSRYLSPAVAPPSPLHTLSPDHHYLKAPKQKQKQKHSGFIRGFWPSSASKYNENENSPVLSKQKSVSKTKHTPAFGGKSATRFTGKLIFPGRPSMSSSKLTSDEVILPGRLSVDENALRRGSLYYQMKSDDNINSDQGSPLTVGRNYSPASYMAPTLSSNNSMHNYNSPKISTIKTTMKRANSLSSSSSSIPEWESSPSRFGSPSFSGSKPPKSSSRGKKNILHIGLDLIKGKKGGSKLQSPLGSGTGTNMENVHRLRMLQNSLMQWRYVNARAHNVHDSLAAQSENKLLCGYESVAKLRQSVVQKRLQLQKEKQEMKLNLILHSQTKMLEAWGEIERRHMLDVSVMKDYLHAVVCMIPLNEGAKVDLESTTTAFQHTSDMAASIMSALSSVSPTADETMVILSELAEVVTQENLLLEECFEHLSVISTLEIQERMLRCSIIAMDSFDE